MIQRIRKPLVALVLVVGFTPFAAGRMVHGSAPAPYQQEEAAAVAAGIYTALPMFPLDTGLGGVNQFQGATVAMLTNYRAKLTRLQAVVAAYGVNAANIPQTAALANCGPDGCPPSSYEFTTGATIEPDGYCGPTSALNALYGLNLDPTFQNNNNGEVYTIASDMARWDPATGGAGGNGSFDPSNGIDRGGFARGHWYGEQAINDFSNSAGAHTNYYTWENVDNAGPLWDDTVADIWGNVAPIFNIASEWKPPNARSPQYPLPQYPPSYNSGRPIFHYFDAYGYLSGQEVQIFDENNFLSQHFWNDSADQLYQASEANTAGPPQILW